MADASFDVVFVGGGYGGLMCAPYFGMNGMSVGVFEGKHEMGGGHDSTARPVPGFTGNAHAHGMVNYLAPQIQDFKLWEKGFDMIFPERFIDFVFPDETGVSIYTACDWDLKTGTPTFVPERYEKTLKNLAMISEKDADTLADLYDKMDRYWMIPIMQHFYNPPAPYGEKDPLEEILDDPASGLDPRWGTMPIIEVIKELFESPKFITTVFRPTQWAGNYPQDIFHVGMMSFVLLAVLGAVPLVHIRGGSHQIAHALQRVLHDCGGKSYANCDVDKILVENGKVKGIKLVDGTEIEARKAVVANIDPQQLIFRHLRDFPVSEVIKKKVKCIVSDRSTLWWGNVCYHERPKYKVNIPSEPDFGDAIFVMMGDPDIDYIANEYQYQCQHIRPGHWPPKLYFWENAPSLFDPNVAPPGKHISLIEEYGPGSTHLSEREWNQVRREAGPRICEEWAKYAPNMALDSGNIIGIEIDTPWDCAHRHLNYYDGSWAGGVGHQLHQWARFRPIPELSQYQVPGIENLFLTGMSYHSGTGSPCGYGYNTYKKAAEKMGLRKFWDEAGRLY